jgi:methyl-accepting chemotaxis protein
MLSARGDWLRVGGLGGEHMWGAMQRRIASLSTATKLLLGFGVVLALTAVVAATGFSALHELGVRSAFLERMSAINVQVLQLRQVEQTFALTGDKQQREQLHAQAQAILQSSETLNAELPASEGEALNEVDGLIAQYLLAFDRYADLTDNMSLSLDAANWLVVSAANSLDLLQEGLAEDGLDLLKSSQGVDGADAVIQAGQMSRVHQLLLQALGQARVRLEQSRSTGEVSQEEISEALDAQRLAGELRDAMDSPGYASVLVEVIGNVDSFSQRLQEYTSLLRQQRQEHERLVEQAGAILDRVDQAYAVQMTQMQRQLQRSTWLILIASVLALAIGLLATVLITLLIVRPLKQVIALARLIAAGDLSTQIQVQRSDEIGQLFAAMQEMSTNLRSMVGRLQAGVVQISSSAQELATVTEQTRQGVDTQKEETEQVATAMSEMTATVHEVARNAEAAATSTGRAEECVGIGGTVVRQTLERINQLAEAMANTTRSIETLSQDTQRIEAILDVIKSVAEQTNLLALNAAIEAARAGDQGRGFAVVADEVRALAKRTQHSTTEIESLVVVLRDGARRSVDAMRQIGTRVDQAVTDANQTEGALADIAEAVTLIFEMNQQIAAAAEEQTAVAEEINRSVTSIRDISDQSATAMQASAASSAQLADLGRELQTMAGHFRL